ncbi:pentapeptide repeat-containing protein [uncultured Thalassospira sp.]|uniref:pentapeptide repeat-containing protein n=1 Tax=uncultured Thalassospira sp. TaxID=404382 RepID=UPI0030DCF0BA
MASMSGLSVLYADYSTKAASLVHDALRPLNIVSFYSCDTEEETLALANQYRPALVMVSHQLEGYQGIKTIGHLRDMAQHDDLYFQQVPVLLGAKSLTRDAMRHAVKVGINGVFRQPLNPDRLHRIIHTVIKSPRRFVLEGDYFGPSRDKDTPSDPANASQQDAENSAALADENGHSDPQILREKSRTSNAGVILRPARITASTSRPMVGRPRTMAAAPLPRPAAKTTKSDRLAVPDDDLPVTPTGTQAGPKTLDPTDLLPTNRGAEKLIGLRAPAANTPPVATAKPGQPAPCRADATNDDTNDDDQTKAEDEDLIDIDIRAALRVHKMWVDTGGKEGKMISFAHADLRNEDLEGIDLTRCVLPQASLHNANCEDAILRRCDLTTANFSGANLKNTILAASRLTGADFKDARLSGTVFLGADLSHANLRGAKLLGCDLSGCNLAKTDLRDADLSSAKGLFSEQIQRARLNINTRLPVDLKLKTV